LAQREAVIRTTLITGFPGETEEHFRHLVTFVEEVGFHHLGVFPFYPEQGSRASELPRQVPPAESAGRAAKIMRVQKKISRSILEAFEDQVLEIIVDSPHGEWPGLFIGRAWFQAPDIDGMTYVSGPDARPGRIISCRIHKTEDYDLTALQD
jgi:ribosomal protein S12 methylthiotransferase